MRIAEAPKTKGYMASKILKKLIAYEIAYRMLPYRNVRIFPRILEKKKKKFSEAEKEHLIRPGNRWYVYYDYLNPKTGNYERQTPITNKVNRDYKDFEDRFFAIRRLKNSVIALLKDGFNPYEGDEPEEKHYTIISALNFAVDIKKDQVKKRTYERYKGTARALENWLRDNGYSGYNIKKADKPLLSAFLRHISSKTSNRTRNNYRSDLSALFGVLFDEDYISENPAAKIKNLGTAEMRDPTYSEDQVKDIFEYLEKEDPLMHVFILMVSYMFWRPIELTRIQIKDINLKERLINETTKTKGRKTKLIPEVLFPHLEKYIKDAYAEDYLFTPKGPGKWENKDKRAYFTRRYAGIKKELNLDPSFTIYSFRHSFITKVYKTLKETKSEEQAMSELSVITGHTSKAIKNYIHWIDANIPEDYSELL